MQASLKFRCTHLHCPLQDDEAHLPSSSANRKVHKPSAPLAEDMDRIHRPNILLNPFSSDSIYLSPNSSVMIDIYTYRRCWSLKAIMLTCLKPALMETLLALQRPP